MSAYNYNDYYGHFIEDMLPFDKDACIVYFYCEEPDGWAAAEWLDTRDGNYYHEASSGGPSLVTLGPRSPLTHTCMAPTVIYEDDIPF